MRRSWPRTMAETGSSGAGTILGNPITRGHARPGRRALQSRHGSLAKTSVEEWLPSHPCWMLLAFK